MEYWNDLLPLNVHISKLLKQLLGSVISLRAIVCCVLENQYIAYQGAGMIIAYAVGLAVTSHL